MHAPNYSKVYALTNFIFLYINVFITFSVVYLFLDIFQLGPLLHSISFNEEQKLLEKIVNSFQLSATKLLSDGYSNIIPVGWSRVVAFIEGAVGFLLPAFIMLKIFPIQGGKLERSKLPMFKLISRSFFVIVGALFVAIGLEIFLVPNQIIDGGIVGISIMMSYITGLKLELFLLLLNLPFLYLGYRTIGKRFVATTLFGLLILSLGTMILYNLTVPTKNLLIASGLGGIFLGIGVGIVIRYDGSLDGTEILGILLNKRTSFSVGKVVMFINIFIFGSAGFVFGWEKVLYSILTYYIASKMIDITIEGFQ